MLRFLILFTTFYSIFGQNVSNDFCYKSVQNELQQIKDPPRFKPPVEFGNIKNLLRKSELIISKLKNLDALKKKISNTRGILDKSRDDMNMIKTGEDLLKEIQENAKKLNETQAFNDKTKEECKKAVINYEKLNDDFNDIKNKSDYMRQQFEKYTPDINKTIEKSLSIKKEVDELKIPNSLSDKYLCESNIMENLKDILYLAKKINATLQDIKNGIINELKELTKKLKEAEIEEPADLPFKKEELQKDIKYYKQKLKEIYRLKELNDKKKKAKQDLDHIKDIAYTMCKNGVCNVTIAQTHVEN